MWFKPPLPINDAFHYAHQLAQALNILHAQGHPHGSLTLSNILILRGFNADHEPDFAPFLLCDAGLANFARFFGQPQITLLPITAAPEQFSQRVTPASDQFALAVLLYFWLAGHPPYLGSTEEIVEQKLKESIVPLTSLNHEVTPSQEALLRKALAVSSEGRFPSILAFTGALCWRPWQLPRLSPKQPRLLSERPQKFKQPLSLSRRLILGLSRRRRQPTLLRQKMALRQKQHLLSALALTPNQNQCLPVFPIPL